MKRVDSCAYNEQLNMTLMKESEDLAQRLAVMEHRVKLNITLEEKLAERTADFRLLQREQNECQNRLAEELHQRANERERLLAAEERNARLTSEMQAMHAQIEESTPSVVSRNVNTPVRAPGVGVVPAQVPAPAPGVLWRLPASNPISMQSTPIGRLSFNTPGIHLHSNGLIPVTPKAPSLPSEMEHLSEDGSVSEARAQAKWSGRMERLSQPKINACLETGVSPANFSQSLRDSRSPPTNPTASLKAGTMPNTPKGNTPVTPVLKERPTNKDRQQQRKKMASDELVELMGEIQNNIAEYVPVKHDLVDQCLAEYINTYQPPVPFFRQLAVFNAFYECL